MAEQRGSWRPNPRVQLTVAMRFGEREVGGESRDVVPAADPPPVRRRKQRLPGARVAYHPGDAALERFWHQVLESRITPARV